MYRDNEQNKLCFTVLTLGSRSWEHFGFAFQVPKQNKNNRDNSLLHSYTWKHSYVAHRQGDDNRCIFIPFHKSNICFSKGVKYKNYPSLVLYYLNIIYLQGSHFKFLHISLLAHTPVPSICCFLMTHYHARCPSPALAQFLT